MYEYTALILDVHDGDTVHAQVDLGFDVRERMTLRLVGIDAPELPTPAGIAARDWLIAALAQTANTVIVRTVKDRREKYGRYLATLYTGDTSINDLMVRAGHARPYDGGRR